MAAHTPPDCLRGRTLRGKALKRFTNATTTADILKFFEGLVK
jgi:hypothetical protein